MTRVVVLDAGPRPTADPRELDCDAVLAAQALTMGVPADVLVIATTNPGHLSLFLAAERWEDLRP